MLELYEIFLGSSLTNLGEAEARAGDVEEEIAELPPAEQAEFLEELGLAGDALHLVITASYRLLDLITFYTIANDKLRAWQLPRGSTAVEAAGKIHSDMADGFIRAEVVSFEDFVRFQGEHGAREAGRLRLEGKDYVVQDGDVMHFRFNV